MMLPMTLVVLGTPCRAEPHPEGHGGGHLLINSRKGCFLSKHPQWLATHQINYKMQTRYQRLLFLCPVEEAGPSGFGCA